MIGERKLRVLAIGDTHAPWAKESVILKIYEMVEAMKFDVIIQLGDLYDMYAYSRFSRSHDVCTPKEEIEEGYNWAINFWKNIHKLQPNARKIQIKGNHDDRLMKRAFDRFPEAASILSRGEYSLYQFPNVEIVRDSRDETEIEGVIYVHGWLTKIGDHARFFQKNVVHGHTHRAGTTFIRLHNQIIWELDGGFVADKTKIPLQYGPTKTSQCIEGVSIIDWLGPRFIPIMEIKK